jgi:TPR repeat protein
MSGALCLMLLLSATGHAESLQEGVAYFNRYDFRHSIVILTSLAEQGNARAQVLLGIIHSEGKGVKKDPVKARLWYRLAAEQGDTAGQFMLGLTYLDETDQSNASAWIRRAARGGNSVAQRFLAKSYKYGWLGLPSDPQLASYWFERAGVAN